MQKKNYRKLQKMRELTKKAETHFFLWLLKWPLKGTHLKVKNLIITVFSKLSEVAEITYGISGAMYIQVQSSYLRGPEKGDTYNKLQFLSY